MPTTAPDLGEVMSQVEAGGMAVSPGACNSAPGTRLGAEAEGEARPRTSQAGDGFPSRGGGAGSGFAKNPAATAAAAAAAEFVALVGFVALGAPAAVTGG